MGIFEFNNRPFLLKADRISKRDRRIYDLLTENKFLIGYPCEVETAGGERITLLQPLSDEDVRALFNEKDSRPVIDRISWDEFQESFILEYGTTAVVKRVAAIAYQPLQCSIIDENMEANTYVVPLPLEDIVYLINWIMDKPYYCIIDLKKTRPDLYARLTDKKRLPRKLQPTSVVLLTGAELIVCKLTDCETVGYEVYAENDKDGNMSHVCVQVNADNEIVLVSETATKNDIKSNGLLVITNGELFRRRTGAYMASSILRAIGTMYHGLDTDLNHFAGYCDRKKIEYILKR